MTLAEHLEAYITLDHKWTTKTRKNNATALNYWAENIGEWGVDVVTPSLVTWARDKIEAKSPTKNRYVAVLSGAMKHAVAQGLREDNPCLLIEPLPVEATKREPITINEQQILLAYMREHYPALAELVYFALLTGAQRQEIEALKWGNIDFDHKLLTIQPAPDAEARTIPIGEVIINLFTDVARRVGREKIFAEALIFEPYSRYKWQRTLDKTFMRSIDFRDLRHTFIVQKINAGYSLALIARYTGGKGVVHNKAYLDLTINDVRGMVE